MRPHCTNADARRMLRAAMLASLAALLLPCVAAAEARLAGTWSGSHGCGSTGGIPFSLTLDDAGSGLVEGELRYDAPQAPGGTSAYRVRGRVNARDRTFVLVPAEWIDRPAGHTAVGLSGTLHDNGLTIEGDLRGCTAIGSRRFTAQRGGAGAPPATAGVLADEHSCPRPVAASRAAGRGAVQCARPPE